MSNNTATTNSNGIGVLGLLGIVFVVLKLSHVIDWSWWWVTAPFWGGFAVAFVIAAVFSVGWVVVKMLSAVLDH